MRVVLLAALLLLGGGSGCATSGADLRIRVHDDPNGAVRYEGPTAGPFRDVDELVETGCERMVEHAASSRAERPLGYCAVFFSAPDDEGRDRWFIGHLSVLEGERGGTERSCRIPVDLVDPKEVEVLSLLGAKGGPGHSGAWRPTHFVNQGTGTTWERDVLVFSLEAPEACTAYGFISFSRVVTVSRGSGFHPIGTVYNEQGIIQALAGSE
ncbi:hypothetical protein [Pyxidicoccus xibeiensis]|uniref:hypothetical protein n=1 Tax=Pyxidicoccus xibeiensis TaxID=2906759 RepID=UPI0020A6E90F|nr:hypothetical protein [Pyxidicoccus xibeiensis]MCP3139990.1 hypothetical protein [Pyxidicoccus xibeiensis]